MREQFAPAGCPLAITVIPRSLPRVPVGLQGSAAARNLLWTLRTNCPLRPETVSFHQLALSPKYSHLAHQRSALSTPYQRRQDQNSRSISPRQTYFEDILRNAAREASPPNSVSLSCAFRHKTEVPIMSFTNAPVTRTLVVGLVSSSLAASLCDLKHYFYILVNTHIWKYHQPWRALIFQLCYTNSSEVLFAAMTLYNMRVVERMWGSRKYAVSLP